MKIKIGLSIQKVIAEDTQKYRHHGDLISLVLFFQYKKISLK
jgi:hypothetical protein